MNGDAAEEVVRMALNGADISIRLVGAGAKNLAALLVAWAKKEKKHVGRTSLPKLLSGGDELHVLSLTEKQYDGFKKLAKKKITYAPFLNTKSKDGKVDIVLGAKQLSFANHILSKVGYRNIEPGTGAHVELMNEKDKEEIFIERINYSETVKAFDNNPNYVEIDGTQLSEHQTKYFKSYKLYSGIKEMNAEKKAGFVLVFDSELDERAYMIEVYGQGNMNLLRIKAFFVMNNLEVLFY